MKACAFQENFAASGKKALVADASRLTPRKFTIEITGGQSLGNKIMVVFPQLGPLYPFSSNQL